MDTVIPRTRHLRVRLLTKLAVIPVPIGTDEVTIMKDLIHDWKSWDWLERSMIPVVAVLSLAVVVIGLS